MPDFNVEPKSLLVPCYKKPYLLCLGSLCSSCLSIWNVVFVFPMWKQDLEGLKLPGNSTAKGQQHQEDRGCFHSVMHEREGRDLGDTGPKPVSNRQAGICLQNYITQLPQLTACELLQHGAGWLIRNEVRFVDTSTALWAPRCPPPVRTIGDAQAVPLGRAKPFWGFTSPTQPVCASCSCPFPLLLQVCLTDDFNQKSAPWIVSLTRCWWVLLGLCGMLGSLPEASVPKSLESVKSSEEGL